MKIEGFPEGFEVKEVLLIECESNDNDQRIYGAQVIVKKKQPRRIVLEETGEIRKPEIGEYIQNNGNFCKCHKPERWGYEHEIWREVKGSDLSLHNDDDKESLRLSVDECKEAMRKLETFNVTDLSVKICRFLKDSK